ncbi:hypothetical protein K7X08_026683 [Anisodus acutangulus]|uniref:Uncharacterized protein n=1 Tax=Anisodus acutangulus TaxID=402998 RepID=A0A9Q1QX90_9SOLA|nr:hypothetical protein K7X08_026683 [Anisodus acutangulus]
MTSLIATLLVVLVSLSLASESSANYQYSSPPPSKKPYHPSPTPYHPAPVYKSPPPSTPFSSSSLPLLRSDFIKFEDKQNVQLKEKHFPFSRGNENDAREKEEKRVNNNPRRRRSSFVASCSLS